MDKKYTLISAIRGGRPRSKRLQKLGVGSGSSVVVNSIQGTEGAASDGHTHDNKSDLDRISTDGEGYEYITRAIQSTDGETDETSIQTVTEKVKAGYADKAGDLSDDSPVLKLINTIGNQFVPTYLDGSTYVDTTWAEIVAGTRTLAAIKSVKGFFSDSFISARGANPDGGGSGSGGVYYLHELLDAAINNPATGQALVYNGTKWVNQAIQTGLDEAALASYLTTHSYATQSWVESKGYLTTHQSLADYVTLNTPQNITANKAFYGEEKFIVSGGTYTDPWSGIACAIKVTGKVGITDSIKAASFIKANGTASQFLMADGNVATKHVLTASNNLGWDGTQGQIPTIDTLAFWNGRYNATNSNLQYCDRGRFGTMAVANAADYLARAGGSMLNTSLVTNLNADLLDGKHSYAFANRCNLDYTTGTSVGDFCKANADTRNAGNILSASGWVWANSRTLKLNDSYSIDNQRYSCITYRNGDLNGTWQQQALLFLPTYSDSNMIYLAQMVVEGTAGSVKTSIKRYADYDTVLASNVASATKLADNTAVKAWGQVFFENGKPKGVSGNMTGVGSITRSNASAVDTDAYGNLKFKSASATTWHIDNMSGAALFAFLSSGNAGIGTATPAYKLDVNGTARVSSLIIGDITLSYDAANGGLHVTGGGLYTDTYLSARGANTSGSGSSGGGLIQQVYGSSSLGGAFSDTTLTDTFNAYTINKIRTDLINADSALSGRITSLEGGAAVSVTTTGSGNAITAISKSGTTITATKGATFLTAHQSLANYVPWSKQSVATVNGTNHNPQFFNIENENLIANYKNYWSVINFGSYSGNNFRSQIAMPYQDSITDTDMFIRTANGSNWRAWRRVLHDGNYASILDSRYYTESEINTKFGNYVTLNTTQTITGLKTFSAAGTTAIFNSTSTTATNVVLKTNGTQRSSIGWYNNFVFISNEPSYTGASTDKFHRLGVTDAGVPQFWTNRDASKYTLLHTGNYTSILDARYVTALGTSGDYLTWTKNGATNNITVPYATTAAQLTGSAEHTGTALTDFDNAHTYACQATNDLGDGISYSAILTVSGGSQHRFFQIIGGKGNPSYLRWRTTDANGTALGAVHRLLDDANYSSILDARYYTETEADARFVNVTGDTMTGLLTAKVAASHTGIKLGNTYLTAINGDTILQNNNAIRFGTDAWDYNQWAGLKYSHTDKTVYLGLADGSIFTANAAQSGGKILTPGISNIYVGNNTTNKVWHAGNDGSGSGLDADKLDGVHNGALTAKYLNRADFVTSLNAVPPFNGIFSWGGTNSANPATYGVMLQWSSADNPTPGTDQHWITQLASATSNRLFYRTRINTGAWSGWSAVAFTSDNVASATKLQTARTLWGQSFNGTANVDGALTVHHTGACGVYISGGGESSYSCQASGGLRWVSGAYPDRYFIWDSSGYGNERLTILNNGNVGIGTRSPSYKLDVSGVIHSTTGMWSNGYVSARGQNTASDARLKTILQTKLLDTRSIAAAPSVLFSWKDTGCEDVGSIAQYWQRIDRHLVSHRPDGYLGLDYGKAALLSVISVAKQTLNHEERIKALERENALLKKQIKSLT